MMDAMRTHDSECAFFLNADDADFYAARNN